MASNFLNFLNHSFMQKLLQLVLLLGLFLGTGVTYGQFTVQQSGFFGPDLTVGGGDQTIMGFRLKDFGNGNGGGDIYVGSGDLGNGAQRNESFFTWSENSSTPVTFTYDPVGGTFSVDVNGTMTSYNIADVMGDIANINHLYVGLRSGATEAITLSNFTVDGDNIGTLTGSNNHYFTPEFCDFEAATSAMTISFSLDLPTVASGAFGTNEGSKVELHLGFDTEGVDCPDPNAPVAPLPALSATKLAFLFSIVLVIGTIAVRRFS